MLYEIQNTILEKIKRVVCYDSKLGCKILILGGYMITKQSQIFPTAFLFIYKLSQKPNAIFSGIRFKLSWFSVIFYPFSTKHSDNEMKLPSLFGVPKLPNRVGL